MPIFEPFDFFQYNTSTNYPKQYPLCIYKPETNLLPPKYNKTNCCQTIKYENIGIIYNCSTSDTNNIGIVSMHVSGTQKRKSSWKMDINRILKNHKAYTQRNSYIYFEITNYTNHTAHTTKLQVLLMKPYLVHKILTENINLQYLVWVDLDTLFFNCSSLIQQVVIHKAYELYQYCADIIFSYEPTTVANSGVVVYANTFWTKQFLKRMIGMTHTFAKYANLIHNGWVDQNLFIALLMGYNDVKYNYSNATEQYIKYLTSDIRYGNEPANTNQTWQWLGDNNNSLFLHSSLDQEIQSHVSLLSPFDMNFGFRYYRDRFSKSQLPHQPFIIHFAGPPSKPFISTTARKSMQVKEPVCMNVSDIKCMTL